ncbi:MAG: hypothetical protein IT180_16575 [Acidobacteria bacterium]|nr:hypothetical protein [Acidobacteriota bacterium]
MIRALAASTVWILSGAAAFAALWWAFVNTPESTVFTLVLSLLLVLGMYAVAALTWSGALVGWSRGWSRGAARGAVAGLPAFLLPVIAAGAAWWMVGAALGWMERHSGEISAWFIATLNWSDLTGPMTAVAYLGEWLRRVVAPFVALVWFGHILSRGLWAWRDRTPLARALSPARLTAATLVAIVTLWAPLHYGLYWMPPGLPATWVEPSVALAKFGLIAIAGAVGLSLIARLASPGDAGR